MSEFDNENPEIPDDLSSLDLELERDDQSQQEIDQTGSEEGSMDEQVEKLTVERDDYLKALQQTTADFDNYRKRMTKQALEMGEQRVEALALKLLPALDNIELALAHSKENEELNSTLSQIFNSLLDVLTKEGLEQIAASGVDFDPTCHDAVMHEPGEGSAKVSEVLRTGYRWKQKVIRPAMVKVVGQG